jgi:2-dehydropantoate 2-reductase
MSAVSRVLVVGAGSVGKSYAYHLSRGGAEVSFFARSKYRSKLEAGYAVRSLHTFGKSKSEYFNAYDVLTDASEVQARRWSQLWLCVSSDALEGEWLSEILNAADASIVVVLQPGIADIARVKSAAPSKSVVIGGVITLVAYEVSLSTPQADQRPTEDALSLWLPPLAAAPFTGPRESVDEVIALLKRGGMKASHQDGSRDQAALASAAMMPLLLGLELDGWSLKAFRKSRRRKLASDAASEALRIAASLLERPPASWPYRWVARTRSVWLPIAEGLAPFPLEAFLKHHFSKVGQQTSTMVRTYIDFGARDGLDTDNLEMLLEAVEAQRATSPCT